MAYDKKLHLACGFAISIIGCIFFTTLIGLALGIAAGVGKEIYDYYDYGLFDYKDMVATWAGSLVGYGVMWLW